MAFFSGEESKLKRAVMVLTGLVAVGLILTLGVLLVSPPKDAPPKRTAEKKPKRTLSADEARVVAGEIYRPTPIAEAKAPTSEARLARAMDDSNARMLVQNLIEAAAADNRPLRASMLGALERTGASARPILERELARAEAAPVRSALEEALTRCR